MSPRRLLSLTVAIVLTGLLAAPAALASNDSRFADQWGLHKVKGEEAWATSTGRLRRVAVLDTGVDFTHPDLKDRWYRSWNCLVSPCERLPDNGPGDIHGHGTWVSGVIAAVANNKQGIAGVAPDAKIIAIRVCGGDGCPGGAISRGIQKAVELKADVINMSLGSSIPVSNSTGFAEDFAAASNQVVVVSAGNDAGLMSSYAAAPNNVVVVGATGPRDEISAYSTGSNIPIDVDIYAPGGNATGGGCKETNCILSTSRGGGYSPVQGTSFSAPHVSGAAALLKCVGLSVGQIVDRMVSSADIVTDPNSGENFPRLNAAKAVAGYEKTTRCKANFPAVADPLGGSQPNTGTSGNTTGRRNTSRGGSGGPAGSASDSPAEKGGQGGDSGNLGGEGGTQVASEEGRKSSDPVRNAIIGGVVGAGVLSLIITGQIKAWRRRKQEA